MGRIAALIHPFGDLGRSSAVARREARLATAACILSRWKGDLATWEGEAWIMWSSFGGRVEAGGLRRFAFFRVQNPRLFRGSGRRRRKESKKVSSDCVDLSRKKRLTNFRIEGAEDLWSLEDRKMLSAEVWESEGSVSNHPIKRVKSRALKNVGRKHFVEAKLVENGGGTWKFLWGGAGFGKSGGR